MSLLGRLPGPTDLKELPTATLPALADEIRAFLIDKVADVGIATAVLKRPASTHRGKVASVAAEETR